MNNIERVSAKEYSSLCIGGDMDMIRIRNEEGLVNAISYAKRANKKIHIVGAGTNSFFGDFLDDFLFLKMEIKGINLLSKEDDDIIFLTAFAGEVFDDVVKYSAEQGLWGIENLSYIPGNIGASPVQNIGAYGVELSDIFVSAKVYDIFESSFFEIDKESCCFGYRDSLFKKNQGRYCIISVTLKLSKHKNLIATYKPIDSLCDESEVTPLLVRDLVIKTRQEKIPDYHTYPNTGSFFKNPLISKLEKEKLLELYKDIPCIQNGDTYKVPAAWLIEHVAEMKGKREGDVGTWPKQPLVIVNYGKATGKEINDFAIKIARVIKQKTGISLEREVNFIE